MNLTLRYHKLAVYLAILFIYVTKLMLVFITLEPNMVFMYLLPACLLSYRFSTKSYFKSRLGGKFHPRYLPWHLPVFTGLENTPQVANTGKYWQIEFFCLKMFQKS